jgi:hypothetical protein
MGEIAGPTSGSPGNGVGAGGNVVGSEYAALTNISCDAKTTDAMNLFIASNYFMNCA